MLSKKTVDNKMKFGSKSGNQGGIGQKLIQHENGQAFLFNHSVPDNNHVNKGYLEKH